MSEATTEKRVVSCCLKSREAFDRIRKHIDTSKFSPYGEWCVDQISAYYDADPQAKSVSEEHLLDLAKIRFDNPSKANIYSGYIREAAGADVSAINVVNLILEQRKKHKGMELSQALANDPLSKRTQQLYQEFGEVDSEELAENAEKQLYNNITVEEINKKVVEVGGRIKLAPKCLNERIKGGVLPGHHIVLFARPETGKTAQVLSMMRAFCLQKLPGIYFGNEDPVLDIISRFQSCLTGMTDEQRAAEPEKAAELLEKNGYKYANFVELTPGTPREMEKYIVDLGAKWSICDQIRNLNVGDDTRVNNLEKAAMSHRTLGKKYGLVAVSVTQAGDSADQKTVLTMGDIDFSNTGIPATADLMIGIGINDLFEQNGEVRFSLPKNKIGGVHDNWTVRRNQKISRMESLLS